MISQTDLEKLGWVFDTKAGTGSKPDADEALVVLVTVSCDFPLFGLIRAANHVEGDDELMDEPITSQLIQQVSGETWVAPPPPPPPVATSADHAEVSAQLVTEKLASVPITTDQLPAILSGLLGQASAAIPFFEKYALDPSMTAPQWVAFQGLDQATKDRLLYDTVRSVAALMRYLTGDLPTS